MTGTRVLVVGPYPPTRDPLGSAVLDDVRGRRRAGDHVEVCSPVPSAAHHVADPTTPGGLLAFGSLARRFDLVVVHHRPDLVEPGGPTWQQAITARLWPVALGRLRDLTVVEYAPESPRGVAATALAGRASNMVRGALPRGTRMTSDVTWPADRAGVQDLVRARAAASRDRAARDLGPQLATVPPLRLPAPTSGRPGIATVRRVLQRLVGWELDPVIGQVNRLRGAVLAESARSATTELSQTSDDDPSSTDSTSSV